MVGDVEFIVERDIKKGGGEFYFSDEEEGKKTKQGKIIIGTKYLESCPTRTLAAIIHELKEAIQETQSVRYKRPDGFDIYEFHYDHRQHEDLCGRLARLLKEFLW